ncbi:MAG: hypothetical protein ABI681_12190 [Gemmatimonadales bacterium]
MIENPQCNLVNEVRYTLAKRDSHATSLRNCVVAVTRAMRDRGEPPEKVLITIKHAGYTAAAVPSYDPLISFEPHATNDVITRMVRWSIEAYYENSVPG